MQTFVLTVIGDDRDGLIEKLSRTISDQGGNWMESSMAQLAGKFAGILRVDVPPGNADALIAALKSLDTVNISISRATPPARPDDATTPRRLHFTLVGPDRPGIVRDLSRVFAQYAVTVAEFNTLTATAPMTDEAVFHVRASLEAAHDLDAAALKADLRKLASDLVVDVTLDEVVSI